MKRISFIMPTYNRAGYIAESIESVISQMGADDEMIVVDDGSVDATPLAVEPYLDKLRYLRQGNAGKSVALNRALGGTTGRYVWICDDDDLLIDGIVNRMFRRIEASGADLVFARYTRFMIDDGDMIDMGTGYWPELSEGSLARCILEDTFVMHNASLVRREAYDRLGPFDPTMLRSQDYEMFARIAVSCTIEYTDEVAFMQRKHSGDRGPARIAHKAGSSESVWEQFDRIIFERVRDCVPQEFFTSMFESSDSDFTRRSGLLQRACILARHGLWDDALIDCKVAAEQLPETALHPLEIAICRRFTAGKHGFSGLLDRSASQAFARLSDAGGVGAAIAAEISRGLFWRLKGTDTTWRGMAIRHLLQPRSLVVLAKRFAGKASGAALPALNEVEPDHRIGQKAMVKWKAHLTFDGQIGA